MYGFIQGCFVSSLVEIGPVVVEKKIFKISSMYFCYFVIISHWKSAGLFICFNYKILVFSSNAKQLSELVRSAPILPHII